MVCLCNVSNWSAYFRHHLVRPFDISNQSVPFRGQLLRLLLFLLLLLLLLFILLLLLLLLLLTLFTIEKNYSYYTKNQLINISLFQSPVGTDFYRLKSGSLIYVRASKSLRRANPISVIQALDETSLKRLRLVSFFQVSLGTSFRRLKSASHNQVLASTSLQHLIWSVSMRYQLVCFCASRFVQ